MQIFADDFGIYIVTDLPLSEKLKAHCSNVIVVKTDDFNRVKEIFNTTVPKQLFDPLPNKTVPYWETNYRDFVMKSNKWSNVESNILYILENKLEPIFSSNFPKV